MPPEVTTAASSKLLDYGVLGAVCVLLIVALIWAVTRWQKATDERTALTERYADKIEALTEKYSALVVRVEAGLTTSTSGMRALETSISQFNTQVQVAMAASRAARTATPGAFPAVRERDREPGSGSR